MCIPTHTQPAPAAVVTLILGLAAAATAQPPGLELLPGMIDPDFSQVIDLDPPPDTDQWTYQPDTPTRKIRQPREDISIILPHPIKTMMTAAAHADTLIAISIDRVVKKKRRTRIHHYRWAAHRLQLSTGTWRRAVPLFQRQWDDALPAEGDHGRTPDRIHLHASSLMSVGPTGDVALAKTNSLGRLDLWKIKGKAKHVAAWYPYDPENKAEEGQLIWAAALDDQHVLTLSSKGDLINWSMPDCIAVWRRYLGETNVRTSPYATVAATPRLSPTHKHIAVWSDRLLSLIDCQSGDILATLPCDGRVGLMPPTFSPDGKELAFTMNLDHTQILLLVDLTTGQPRLRKPLPADLFTEPMTSSHPSAGFNWLGNDLGLINGQLLIDLPSGKPQWRFEPDQANRSRSSLILRQTHGPVLWRIVRDRQTRLIGQHMPGDRQARERPLDLKLFAAEPGSSITLQVNVGANPETVKTIEDLARQRIAYLQMAQADNQPVVLRVSTSTKQSDRVARRGGRFGFGHASRDDDDEINIPEIELKVAWTVRGKEVWSQVNSHSLYGQFYTDEESDKSRQQQARDLIWKNVAAGAPKLFDRVPGHVVDPDQLAKIPKGPLPEPITTDKK
ncbi:MAG: hypothetical protein CMJ49_01635 [Planctomycetaceae bacterium]|nr:hypothetical protein [Planctomycetaceae bacterium]